jgi:hypothetical protein
MGHAYEEAEDWWEGDSAGTVATPYGELPVVSGDRRAELDRLPDRDGGHFRMGAQVGWSGAREGFAEPPRPPRKTRRWALAGTVASQPVLGCSECGGIVATASDLATRQPVEYAWRHDVDPSYRPLGEDETCAGCHRQGGAIGRRTTAAEVAARVAEGRWADRGDPWAWTRGEAGGDEGEAS